MEVQREKSAIKNKKDAELIKRSIIQKPSKLSQNGDKLEKDMKRQIDDIYKSFASIDSNLKSIRYKRKHIPYHILLVFIAVTIR